jgi:hypothetical protein
VSCGLCGEDPSRNREPLMQEYVGGRETTVSEMEEWKKMKEEK